MRRAPIAVLAVAGIVVTWAGEARAIRPFITDDARVVGARLLQLETWVVADRGRFEHWAVPAFGPTDYIELTVGAVHGASYERGAPSRYGMAGPLLQAKLLLHAAKMNGWPGLALAGGMIPGLGFGGFETPMSGFLYVAVTMSIGERERLLIHANLGVHVDDVVTNPVAGLGAQVRTVRGLHAVGEIVYGDPYAGDTGAVVQGGFRYIFNDHVQLDGTAGVGIAHPHGTPRPPWGSLGLRLVSSPLW